MAAQATADGWTSLQTGAEELLLANTLVTGQSFRWRRTGGDDDTYTGVIGQRLVQMRQLPGDVQWRVLARSPSEDAASDAAALHDYFNLDTSLAQLSQEWAQRCPRYALIAPALPGCRMLRQDPVECLFQFICSSNNHISRIHGMVERLCSTYGTRLEPTAAAAAAGPTAATAAGPDTPAAAAGQSHQQQQPHGQLDTAPLPFFDQLVDQPEQPQQAGGSAGGDSLPSFYAFPTLEQLSAATDEALRADGFGYRAKFIVGSVQQLLQQPEGGSAWLLSLRDKPYAEAHEALCSLPGVGPKVAACICLFSLDKHDAIPVDTHVWDLATRYYAPHLAKKSLTPKLHAEVQQAFVSRFGPYAGWAHNCLFIGELASHKHLLPAGGSAAAGGGAGGSKQKKGHKKRAAEAEAEAASDVDRSSGGGSGVGAALQDAAGVAGVGSVSTPAQGGSALARRRRRTPSKKQQEALEAAAAVGANTER